MSAPFFATHDVISAKEFLGRVGAAKSSGYVPVRDVEVIGEVNLAGGDFASGLVIEHVVFRDAVHLHNGDFRQVCVFRDCAFARLLDLSNATFESGLRILNCRFGLENARLDMPILQLEGANVRSDIRIVNSSINGIVAARRLDLKGDLLFRGCTIQSDASEESATVDLANAHVIGTVDFGIEAPYEKGTAFDSLRLVGPRHAAKAMRCRFTNNSKDGDAISLCNARATSVSLGVSLFKGHVDCKFLVSSSFSSSVGEFGTGTDDPSVVRIGGADISGDLIFSAGDIGGIWLGGISVGGSVEMFDGTSGQIEVFDSVYEQESRIVVVPGRLGNFFMSRWHCHDFVKLHVSTIKGEKDRRGFNGVHILSCTIDRRFCMWPGESLTRRRQKYFDAPAGKADKKVCILCEDGTTQPLDGAGARAHVNRWMKRMRVFGKISFKHCSIGENLVLTGVYVEHDDGGGSIEAIHCTVKGDVKFDSPVSYLSETEEDDSILRFSARFVIARHAMRDQKDDAARINDGVTIATAECDWVDFQDMTAEEVELSGLRMAKSAASSAESAGGVNLQASEIKGRIKTLARLSRKQVRTAVASVLEALEAHQRRADIKQRKTQPDDQPEFPDELLGQLPEHDNFRWDLLAECFGQTALDAFIAASNRVFIADEMDSHAVIPGSLNLQHATIDELVVSDASFCDCGPHCSAEQKGIVLSYAKLNKLYVARRRDAGAAVDGHNGFPVPLNLLDIEVRSWFLEDRGDRRAENTAFVTHETTTVDPYLDLLDNDRMFRMSTYLAIERSLRDRGLESEARQIFIAGRYRDPRVAKDKWPENLEWRPGDGRYRERGRGLRILRLKRRSGEYRSVVFCVAWILGDLVFASELPLPASVRVFAGTIGMVLGYVALRKHTQVFFDHLFWSVVDYGTSAARLAIVIGILMLMSFTLATGPLNFEPTLAAKTAWAQNRLAEASLGGRTSHAASILDRRSEIAAQDKECASWRREWDEAEAPLKACWPIPERLWMTLRYHVPLVDAATSEEWQPSVRPLHVPFISAGRGGPPSYWRFSFWPRARDWFGTMAWLNWILWPLFLPYLIRIVSRSR